LSWQECQHNNYKMYQQHHQIITTSVEAEGGGHRPKPLGLSSSIYIQTAFAVNTLSQPLTHSQ